MDSIIESEGYKKLLAAVNKDEEKSPGFHDYHAKLDWIVARATHYADKTGIAAADILTAWENVRSYWYMNYYQESKQPLLDGGRVFVFDEVEDFQKAVGDNGFRCPKCEAVSGDAYACTVGDCDWKVYGLFSDLGKGAFVFVKSKMLGQRIFMPIAFEAG